MAAFLGDLSQVGEEGNLAPVLTQFSHFFKMYNQVCTAGCLLIVADIARPPACVAQYVSNYDSVLTALRKLNSNKKFIAFQVTHIGARGRRRRRGPQLILCCSARAVVQEEARKGCGGLDIVSFLIMPVQRIPRCESGSCDSAGRVSHSAPLSQTNCCCGRY